MVDQAPRQANRTGIPSLRARLRGRRVVLLVVAGVLVVMVLTGRLMAIDAIMGFAAVLATALIVPPARRAAGMPGASGLGHERAADQMVQRFADALADPCLILDRRSVIVHRNRAAERQFAAAVTGDPIAFSLRNPTLLAAIETVRQSGTATAVELHQTVPTETWHKVTVAPLVGGGGDEGRRLVITLHDLTEAKRVDAMRADFIANASHELRTPLTSLVGFIDTLLGPASRDAEARERFLAIMRTQANRMAKLIEDLLSLSRIEMHQHVRPTKSLDVSVLLREVSEGLVTQAREAGVAVNLDLPPEPVIVTGDRDELYEVFENLIDNAIKYGGDGGRVDVALGPVSDRHGYDYLISVTDYGAGVEAEHVPRLTERFYRVDAESSRKKKGTGLGLAIVKHIINRHRGMLTIRSKPGEGTRIDVLLPK